MNSKLEILCGECGEKNTFETTSPVVCQKCQKPLSDQGSYSRFGKTMAYVMLSAGIGGTWAFNAYTEENRYPIFDEHKIVEECINGSGKGWSSKLLIIKKNVCVCALKGAQEDFDAESRREEGQRFMLSFKSHTKACLEGKS